MKKLLLAAAVAALSTGSAFATDFAMGGFEGHALSTSVTGGIAATGGIAGNGNSGKSMVENGQYAAHAAGAHAGLTFGSLDGKVFPGKGWGVGGVPSQETGQKPGKGGPSFDLDGVVVDLDVATYSEGAQGSYTKVVDKGTGTAGIGGGIAASGGGAFATGSFKGFGFTKW
jgi:hypothetical protein